MQGASASTAYRLDMSYCSSNWRLCPYGVASYASLLQNGNVYEESRNTRGVLRTWYRMDYKTQIRIPDLDINICRNYIVEDHSDISSIGCKTASTSVLPLYIFRVVHFPLWDIAARQSRRSQQRTILAANTGLRNTPDTSPRRAGMSNDGSESSLSEIQGMDILV